MAKVLCVMDIEWPVPGSEIVRSAKLRKREHENKTGGIGGLEQARLSTRQRSEKTRQSYGNFFNTLIAKQQRTNTVSATINTHFFNKSLLRCSEKGVKIYKVRNEQRSTNSVVYILTTFARIQGCENKSLVFVHICAVMEVSIATVNNNSPIQDYVHPNDQTQPTFWQQVC